jgi:hypothetical protein
MISLVVPILAFVCTFGAAMVALVVHRRLSDHHLATETKDSVKLVMGLISVMSALVLSLLIAAAHSTYETRRSELNAIAADVVELNRLLTLYGPETTPLRMQLRDNLMRQTDRIWAKDSLVLADPEPANQHGILYQFYDRVRGMAPETEGQRQLQMRALQLGDRITATRFLLAQHTDASMLYPFLGILMFWLTLLFAGFGLFARANAIVVGAMLVGALSVASAVFLILDMNQPFRGLMRLSDLPLREAILALSR